MKLMICLAWIWSVLCSDQTRRREEYAPFVTKLLSKGKFYPAIIISGLAFATTRELEEAKNISLCISFDDDPDDCVQTKGVVKSAAENLVSFVRVELGPFYSQELQTLIYYDDPSKARRCDCVSYKHDASKVDAENNENVRGSLCEHMDALFCDDKYSGALVTIGEKRFKLVKYMTMFEIAIKIVGDDRFAGEFDTLKNISSRLRSNGARLYVDVTLVTFPMGVAILTIL